MTRLLLALLACSTARPDVLMRCTCPDLDMGEVCVVTEDESEWGESLEALLELDHDIEAVCAANGGEDCGCVCVPVGPCNG